MNSLPTLRRTVPGAPLQRLPLRSNAPSVQTKRQCEARSQSNNKDKTRKPESTEKVRKAVEAMRRDGVDEKVARKVLQAWEEEGIDSKSLRRKLLGVGLSVVGLAAFQLFTDVLAAYCSTTTATIFEQSNFFGAGFLAITFRTLYYYFAIGAAFDTFRLGAVIGGAATLGAKSDTLYDAIEELAGEQSGIALFDKAQAAVSTTKVVLALNSVRRAVRAEKEYKFKVEDVEGLTQEDAMTAAALFARFDINDDGRLEMSEFKKLCDEADFGLSNEEAKAAIQMLDKRGSGYVEFDEFVGWWSGVTHPVEAAADAAKVA